jgi:hypothetical protein
MKTLSSGAVPAIRFAAQASVGVWIDHRRAVLVFITEAGEVLKTIESDAEKHGGRIDGIRSTVSYESQKVPADDRRQSAFTGQLNDYYDEVIASLGNAGTILIFGPGEAKGELKKRIEKLSRHRPVITIETADKMTDRQTAVKVRSHFQS